MEYKQLVAYSLSSIGFITLINQLFKIIRYKQHLKSYFRNKVILITGASSGLGTSSLVLISNSFLICFCFCLGAALAEELYPLDAQLILCARRLDELNKVKEKLMKLPKVSNKREPVVVCLDVTDPLNVVKKKLDDLVTKLGCIDILINNAGVSFRGEV